MPTKKVKVKKLDKKLKKKPDKKLDKTQEKKQDKEQDKKPEGFVFRVKLGDREIELRGAYEEVTKTIENLPNLMGNVNKAFDITQPKTVATITVKTEQPPTKVAKKETEESKQSYPKIPSSKNCSEAILKFLETDWGKWRPRTMKELKEAMKFNKLKYPGRMLSATLDALAEKGKVRRWNTNTGFVYILAEEKSSAGGKSK